MIPRHIKPLVVEALRHFPVAAILGARQVGKSTLAQDLPARSWRARYLTLDEFALLEAAQRDPDGFVDGLAPPVILDEVQRAPEVLRSVKRVVDRERRPGLFLLTGSANLMTLKSVSESLAGRVALFELHPFSFSELARRASASRTLDLLFASATAKEFVQKLSRRKPPASRAEVTRRLLGGGYPVPSLMKPGRARKQWFESYRQTYLERDLRDVASILRLPDFGRLLRAVAVHTSTMLNTAALSRELGIPINTVRRYLGLMETTYQVFTVRPYFVNIKKRLVKTPKLYFSDTGMAAHLTVSEDWETLEAQGRAGAMVETWVAGELRKAVGLCERRTEIHYWRTHAGREVDFILARGEQLAAVEVKWGRRMAGSDLAGIKGCRDDLAGRLGLGVVLYSGEHAFALDDRTAAVPLGAFFNG